MAKDKKSFILYADQEGIFKKLPKEVAGELIVMIFDFINDRNPKTDDVLLQIAFEPIKQQLKRDLKDWESEKDNRSKAGKKGMKSRWGKRENITNDNKNNTVINPITKITDNVTVNVNDNVTDIDIGEKKIDKKPGFIWPDRNHKIELSEMEIGMAIEYISRAKNTVVTNKDINALFGAFKIKNFTGDKSYQSREKIISHFFETLKFEKIEKKRETDVHKMEPQPMVLKKIN